MALTRRSFLKSLMAAALVSTGLRADHLFALQKAAEEPTTFPIEPMEEGWNAVYIVRTKGTVKVYLNTNEVGGVQGVGVSSKGSKLVVSLDEVPLLEIAIPPSLDLENFLYQSFFLVKDGKAVAISDLRIVNGFAPDAEYITTHTKETKQQLVLASETGLPVGVRMVREGSGFRLRM